MIGMKDRSNGLLDSQLDSTISRVVKLVSMQVDHEESKNTWVPCSNS